MELSTEITLPGTDLEVTCIFDYTPYVPAKISGPPENCHPAEGGDADLTMVLLLEDDILPMLNDRTIKFLTDRCETWAREQS